MSYTIFLIPFFPLLGSLFLLFLGQKLKRIHTSIIGTGSVCCSFVLCLFLFSSFLAGGNNLADKNFEYYFYPWLELDGLQVSVSFLLDSLSFVMVLIITGVGFLIHLYSVGYMKEEKSYSRFFSFLNLFVFFMLILVMADNLVLLFLGWEGVGLCSYLLIGFYLEKEAAAKAAKKAFVVNRIGDFCFIVALMFVFYLFGTFEISAIKNSLASQPSQVWIDWLTLLLFLSATAKSAQIPLHIWLPDAMEGPTPVSALIHAATMVTAGVYLLAKFHFLFILSPLVLSVILVVGTATALLGSLIAIVQNDVKKILAYSTISQLGYMFMALGVGAFSSAIFHLTTHAFFKALLFLSAGALIYVLHHEQNIQKMGGLRKKIPQIWLPFSIGAWCLAGLPLASGFFSKDEILWQVYQGSFYAQWFLGIGILTAFLSSIYTYRMMNLIFYSAEKFVHTPKKLPLTMRSVLLVLAGGSILIGFLGLPHFLGLKNLFSSYFHSFFITKPSTPLVSMQAELLIVIVSVLLSLLGMFWMRAKYYRPKKESINSFNHFFLIKFFHKIAENKFYIETLYNFILIKPLQGLSQNIFLQFVEKKIFPQCSKVFSNSVFLLASVLSLWQNGQFFRFYWEL